jgi:hypothetical protein
MCFRVDCDEAMEHRNCQCCYEGLQTNVHIQLSTRFHISAVITTKVRLWDNMLLQMNPTSHSEDTEFSFLEISFHSFFKLPEHWNKLQPCPPSRLSPICMHCHPVLSHSPLSYAIKCEDVEVDGNMTPLTVTRKCNYYFSFSVKSES